MVVAGAAERRADDLVHDLAQKKLLAALAERQQVPAPGHGEAERKRHRQMQPLDEGEVALPPEEQKGGDPGERRAHRPLGQRGEAGKKGEPQALGQSAAGFVEEIKIQKRAEHEESERHVDARAGRGPPPFGAGGEDDGGGDPGGYPPKARGREGGEQHADGGEERGRETDGELVERAGRERRERRDPVKQRRLGGNLGPGAERQDPFAGVPDLPRDQAFARLALVVKRNLPGAPDVQRRAEKEDERGAGGDGEKLAALSRRNS